jgi:predicted dehydrogenase
VRLGIVGAGEVAWRHAAAAASVEGLSLAAVVDRDASRGRALATAYGSKAVDSLDEVLTLADLVVLAVPHALHLPMALRAFEAGRRVLVEKPLATTAADCDRMIAAGGDLLYVGQQGRFFAQVRAARPALADLGEPLLYHERRSTSYDRADRPAWFADRELAGGGIAMLVGVHSIDRASWLLDAAVREVAATIAVPEGWSVETSAAATLFLDRGLRAHLTLVDSSSFFHETTIVCARGTVTIDPSGLTVDGRRVLTVDGDREYTTSFQRQYEAIVRGEPTVTPAEGRRAVAAVEALYRSAAAGGVPVPLG